MSESITHILLVKEISNWVTNHFDNVLTTWIDCPERSQGYTQPKFDSFIPDYYGKTLSNNCKYIIGEAKTPNDLQTTHSEEQIKSFLRYCNKHTDTELVIAVPWNYERFARNFISSLKKDNNTNNAKVSILGCLLNYY